jgi:hypothetical protein
MTGTRTGIWTGTAFLQQVKCLTAIEPEDLDDWAAWVQAHAGELRWITELSRFQAD